MKVHDTLYPFLLNKFWKDETCMGTYVQIFIKFHLIYFYENKIAKPLQLRGALLN